jgi:hypothetical protein
MKNLKTIALALTVVFSTLSVTANKKSRCFKSSINWVGKVTGQHSGTVSVKRVL